MAEKENTTSEEEPCVTMVDILEREKELEEEYAAVLGASDEKCCTYTKVCQLFLRKFCMKLRKSIPLVGKHQEAGTVLVSNLLPRGSGGLGKVRGNLSRLFVSMSRESRAR